MIPLVQKNSSSMTFEAFGHRLALDPASAPQSVRVIVETGVAIVNFSGTDPNDWTRDFLTFTVGESVPQNQYLHGLGTAAIASFITPQQPLSISSTEGEVNVALAVTVTGQDGLESGTAEGIIPEFAATGVAGGTPSVGCAADAASISYSTADRHPVIRIDLATFGTGTTVLRVSYTAQIMILVPQPVPPHAPRP
jgi:hypothetical protein